MMNIYEKHLMLLEERQALINQILVEIKIEHLWESIAADRRRTLIEICYLLTEGEKRIDFISSLCNNSSLKSLTSLSSKTRIKAYLQSFLIYKLSKDNQKLIFTLICDEYYINRRKYSEEQEAAFENLVKIYAPGGLEHENRIYS